MPKAMGEPVPVGYHGDDDAYVLDAAVPADDDARGGWPRVGPPSALLGLALDGFPVYGPYNASGDLQLARSSTATMATVLDECNFDARTRRYHATPNAPHLPSCFRGAAKGAYRDALTSELCPARGVVNTVCDRGAPAAWCVPQTPGAVCASSAVTASAIFWGVFAIAVAEFLFLLAARLRRCVASDEDRDDGGGGGGAARELDTTSAWHDAAKGESAKKIIAGGDGGVAQHSFGNVGSRIGAGISGVAAVAKRRGSYAFGMWQPDDGGGGGGGGARRLAPVTPLRRAIKTMLPSSIMFLCYKPLMRCLYDDDGRYRDDPEALAAIVSEFLNDAIGSYLSVIGLVYGLVVAQVANVSRGGGGR